MRTVLWLVLLTFAAPVLAQLRPDPYPGSQANGYRQNRDMENYYQDLDRRNAQDSSRRTIVCGSDDGQYKHCPVPWQGKSRLVKQLSSVACTENSTWGVDGNGVWVTGGCRGRFGVADQGGG
jgi:hypothetical protein